MFRPKLALARPNYSQLYEMYDKGKTYKDRDVLVPYHLLNLAGYIRQEERVEVEIFDAEVSLMNQAELASSIIDWKPHFVGLTATTPDIELSLEVCRLIKDHNPSIVTIIGGPHATAMPEDVAQHECVDFVVIGDGEEPLAQIIETGQSRSRAGSKGATPASQSMAKMIRGNGQAFTNHPMPAHDLLDYSNYQFTDPTRGRLNTASVMSSRGCPFRCIFCANHNRKLMYRKVDDFISEIEYLYREKDVRYFFIYDDTFLVSKPRTLEIVSKIKTLGLKDGNFQCQTRANLVTPEIVEALREANCVRMSMGVESGSEEILKVIAKEVKKEDYIKTCRILTDQGIESRASFILGHPYESRETVMETIDFAKELDLVNANFNIMTPYPGTKVYEMALKGEGLRFSRPEYSRDWKAYRRWGRAIIETDELSANDLVSLQQEAIVEFYSQPKVFDYYRSLFEMGNRSLFFFRPLNFAWREKFSQDVPFWDELDGTKLVDPG